MRFLLAILLVVQMTAARLECPVGPAGMSTSPACMLETNVEACCCGPCGETVDEQPLLCLLCRAACDGLIPYPWFATPGYKSAISAAIQRPPVEAPRPMPWAGGAPAWSPAVECVIGAKSALADRLRPVVCIWTI